MNPFGDIAKSPQNKESEDEEPGLTALPPYPLASSRIPRFPLPASSSLPDYDIQDSTGKGLGVFATRDIAAGTRIWAEAALVELPHLISDGDTLVQIRCFSDVQRDQLLDLSSWAPSAYLKRWRGTGEKYYKKHGGPRAEDPQAPGIDARIMAIIVNKAFNLQDPDREHRIFGVFPTAARLNHSCVPNTSARYNKALGQLTVHALRDIATGEELEIDYIWTTPSRAFRQQFLEEYYGFTCTCRACSDLIQSTESDARREHVKTFDTLDRWEKKHARFDQFEGNLARHHLLADKGREESLKQRLEEQSARVLTLVVEGLADERLAQAYLEIARVYHVGGNLAKELEMARMALGVYRSCVGEDHPEYLTLQRDIEKLDQNHVFGTP